MKLINRLIIVFLVNLISSSYVHAISFDVWRTGMSRQEVIAVAQQKNIPLARDGLIHANKEFNPQLLSGDATRYYYSTTLLYHAARVRLILSPAKAQYGQFLYEIEVSFTDIRKNKDLLPYVSKMLEEKYGKGRIEKDIFLTHRVWKPEPDAEVRLISSTTTITIKYTDLKIKKFAEDLSRSTYELPNKPSNHKDAGKF